MKNICNRNGVIFLFLFCLGSQAMEKGEVVGNDDVFSANDRALFPPTSAFHVSSTEIEKSSLVTFSNDSTCVFLLHKTHGPILWDLDKRVIRRHLTMSEAHRINSMGFSKDDAWLLFAFDNGSVYTAPH
jgi:hypothetical protein